MSKQKLNTLRQVIVSTWPVIDLCVRLYTYHQIRSKTPTKILGFKLQKKSFNEYFKGVLASNILTLLESVYKIHIKYT